MKRSKHGAERMKERLGIELTPELEADIIDRILKRRAVLEKKNPEKNCATYRLTIGGQVVRVVFGYREQKIVTVMQSRLLTFSPKPIKGKRGK